MLEHIYSLSGHEEKVWHASWTKDGKYLSTCGEDRTVRIWGPFSETWDGENTVTCISTLEDGQSRTVRCCEWNPDSNMIASASFDGTVVVWESQNRSMRNWDMIASLEGHENEVKSVCWSCDGRWIATCGRDKTVWIWESVGRGEFECVTVLNGHTQDVKFVMFHPHLSSVLYSCSYDDSIKVWREEGDDWYCAETLAGHSSTVWGLSLNSTGTKLISSSADKSLICWNDTSGGVGSKGSVDGLVGNSWMKIGMLEAVHRYPIYSVDWSGANGYVASGGGDNNIAITRVGHESEGSLLSREYVREDAHDGDVNCVRWNPADSLSHVLVSTGDDCIVKLWRFYL